MAASSEHIVVKIVADAEPLASTMRIVAKHLIACADELEQAAATRAKTDVADGG